MAIASATTIVTGDQGVVTTVLAADVARTDIWLANYGSRGEVDVYIGGNAIPFERLDPTGLNARLRVSGNAAQLGLTAVCQAGALRLRVMALTA